MESTGVYWRPAHNALEGYMEIILVNARHVKNLSNSLFIEALPKRKIARTRWPEGSFRSRTKSFSDFLYLSQNSSEKSVLLIELMVT